MATASTSSPRSSRNLASSPRPNSANSCPLNSEPPSTMTFPARTVDLRSAGQSKSGGIEWLAGPATRTTATRYKPCRSSTALVACVVPSITWVIRSRDTLGARTTESRTDDTPSCVSDVVGVFALARTRSLTSRTTASVLVPPTSIPTRRSTLPVIARGDRGGSRRRSRRRVAQPLPGPGRRPTGSVRETQPLLPAGHIGCVRSRCRAPCGCPGG